MYYDALIIILLILASASVIIFYDNKISKEQKFNINNKVEKYEQVPDILQGNISVDLDDKFLYSDNDLNDIYGKSREDEQYDDDNQIIYNDEGEDNDDPRTMWEIVDNCNNEQGYLNDEEVDSNFDGVYQHDMYDVDNQIYVNGTSSFATY